MLLDLKMEKGAMEKGMQTVSRSWKGWERDSPLEPIEGTSANFSLAWLILNFCSPGL